MANTFIGVAVVSIGIGVILMVGYVVVSQVRTTLPTDATYQIYNGSEIITVDAGANISGDLDSVQATMFAGFALTAVGIIVLVSFAIISVFRQ